MQTLKQRTELRETRLLHKVVSSLFLDLFQTSFKKAFAKNVLKKCVDWGWTDPPRQVVSWEGAWALWISKVECSLTSLTIC